MIKRSLLISKITKTSREPLQRAQKVLRLRPYLRRSSFLELCIGKSTRTLRITRSFMTISPIGQTNPKSPAPKLSRALQTTKLGQLRGLVHLKLKNDSLKTQMSNTHRLCARQQLLNHSKLQFKTSKREMWGERTISNQVTLYQLRQRWLWTQTRAQLQ